MSIHWSEAQDNAREQGPGNFVFSEDESAWIAGAPDRGWLVATKEQCLYAQTAQGVELVIEELNLTPLGWH